MRRTVLIFTCTIAAALTVALAGCSGGKSAAAAAAPKSPDTHTITVKFELTDADGGSSCQGGQGGYSDLGPGAAVTVYDGDNKVIATSALGTDCAPAQLDGKTIYWDSTWTTVVPNVPDRPFYQVEVSHRGKLTFNRADLAAKDWTVTASLGS